MKPDFMAAPLHPKPSPPSPPPCLLPKHKHLLRLSRTYAQPEGTIESGVKEEDPPGSFSALETEGVKEEVKEGEEFVGPVDTSSWSPHPRGTNFLGGETITSSAFHVIKIVHTSITNGIFDGLIT